jgi:drug/metabolite transporter (DMT)-like permease
MTTRYRPTDWAMLLTLTAMWGSSFVLTKMAVTGLPAPLVAAGRLIVACLLLIVLMAIMGYRLPQGRRLWAFYGLIAIFGNAAPFSLISWGQSHIDSGLAGILMAVMPLATLSLAHFLIPGERMTPYRVSGFMLGFLGILVLMGPDALLGSGSEQEKLLPMLAVLGGALCYAISSILARLRPPSEAVPSAAATTLLAAALLSPVAFGGNQATVLTEADSGQLAAVAALGVFSTALAGIVYFRLIGSAGPAFVSQLNYLIPLWAVFTGALLMGETLQPNQLLALLIILGGILVTQLEQRQVRGLKRRLIEACRRFCFNPYNTANRSKTGCAANAQTCLDSPAHNLSRR